MKMVKLTGLNAQDTVAKLMLEYTSLIPFKTKLAAQKNVSLRLSCGVKYAKRADVKLSVHCSFTFFLSFSSTFLLACVRTFYVVLFS